MHKQELSLLHAALLLDLVYVQPKYYQIISNRMACTRFCIFSEIPSKMAFTEEERGMALRVWLFAIVYKEDTFYDLKFDILHTKAFSEKRSTLKGENLLPVGVKHVFLLLQPGSAEVNCSRLPCPELDCPQSQRIRRNPDDCCQECRVRNPQSNSFISM